MIADKQWLQRTSTYNHGLLWTIFFGHRVKPASCVVKPLQLDPEMPSRNLEGTPNRRLKRCLLVGCGLLPAAQSERYLEAAIAVLCGGATFLIRRSLWAPTGGLVTEELSKLVQ
jgi:hypothetical protein